MKLTLFSFVLTLWCTFLFAQEPEWVKFEFRNMKYPTSTYLVGFSKDVNRDKSTENDFIEKIKGYAKTELIEGVQSSIFSISTSEVLENNKSYNEYFKKSSVSASNLTVVGLKFQTYYDQKSKTGYALAFAKKEDVYAMYQNQIKQDISSINQKFEQSAALSSNKNEAIKALNLAIPLFRDIEAAQTVMYVLKSSATDDELHMTETNQLRTELESKLASFKSSQSNSIDDAASTIVLNIYDQLQDKNSKFQLQNFTYQDSKMGSPFARRLSDLLEQNLVKQQFSVIRNVVPGTNVAGLLLLTGTYWEENNQIRIIAMVKEMVNGSTIASSEAILPVSWLTENNILYQPENFNDAYSRLKAFSKNEVTGGGLLVDLWTNKGDENLFYTEGDVLKIYVRANKECYIRVVDYMADGSQVLFVDNYYISSDKVNKVYELPYEFECSAPFGIETIQLNAQSEPFKKLNTRNEDGYEFVVDDLPVILANSRGFKKINDETLKAEKRLTMTTMGR